jgi:uncharacterized protein with HEPN domain
LSDSRLADLLEQMRASAGDALSFVEGMGREDFLNDKRTQHAVVMCLHIIGEAAKKILDGFPEFVALRPEIRLEEMHGIRNRIAHGYVLIDQERVWDTVQLDRPTLTEQINRDVS